MTKEKHLRDIANILRRDSLISTTEAGSGHPSSSLSSAEIISCLFFSQMSYDVKNPNNPDNDEFILSKGHASPILYSALYRAGCINHDLRKLRKLSSPLEGHPIPRSLSWIKVATGSLGQGLSVGVGMALAAKIQERKFKTYVLMGDSEISEGSVYEAAEIASHYKLNNLIAIIDVNRLGQTGETMLGHDLKDYQNRFKSFGWRTFIVNGHNIKQILKALKKSGNSDKPSIIIAKTFKGKGVSFIENKEGWHGKALNKEDLERALKELPNSEMPKIGIKSPRPTKNNFKKGKTYLKQYTIGQEIATREAYGDSLSSLTDSDSSVLAIDAEVSNSTYSEKVKSKTPRQFLEMYIAEQNMVGTALGLSKKGFNVFASSFASFLSRAHDQIRISALSSANLTLCGSHAGVSIGEDGPSQMGLEDIALFRSLPDSVVFYPSDAVSTQKIINLCYRLKNIKYIRTTRPKTPVIYKNSETFKIGDFKILKESSTDKAVLIGAGITLHESLKAYESLKEKKKNVAVIDLYCIKPLNEGKLINFVKKHGNHIILAEDHYKEGGIGEAVLSVIANENIRFTHLFIEDIPHSGTGDQLLEKYNLDWRSIMKAVE